MFIKPNPNQKPKKHHPKEQEKSKEEFKEWMTQDEMRQLSRDYVLEHEGLTILSLDEVIEKGRNWDDSIDYDGYGYRICDLSDGKEVPYTGLLYELYQDGDLSWYGYYQDGLEIKEDVTFFGAGEVHIYHGPGRYYEWRPDGNIRLVRVRNEKDLYLHIAKNGKITRLTWAAIHVLHSSVIVDRNGMHCPIDLD